MIEIETLGRELELVIRPYTDLYVADETISALRVVRLAAPGHVVIARLPEPQALGPLGVAVQSAAIGGEINAQRSGPIFDALWAWSPGLPVLLGEDGVLTQTQPAGQPYAVVIGVAVDATTLMVRIAPAIRLAD